MYKVSLIEERNILVTRKRKVWWSPKTTQTVRRAVVQMMDKKSTITFEIILNWKLDKVIGWYCSILFDPENFKSNKIQIYPWQEPILSEKLQDQVKNWYIQFQFSIKCKNCLLLFFFFTIFVNSIKLM